MLDFFYQKQSSKGTKNGLNDASKPNKNHIRLEKKDKTQFEKKKQGKECKQK